MTSSVLMIIIAAVILLLLVATIILRKNRKTPTNYKSFFIIGIIWIPLGIATQNYVFLVLGALFILYGLLNKSKWKDYPKWRELPPELKRMKIIAITILGIILLAGIVFYFLY